MKISPKDRIVSLFLIKGSKTRIDPSKVRLRDNVCIREVAKGIQNKNKLAPPGGNSYYRDSLPDSRSTEFSGDSRMSC